MSFKRPPEQCFCSKCGAEPGQACITKGGNRTTIHKARRGEGTRAQHMKATAFECWKTGFRHGANGGKIAAAEEVSTTVIYPGAYMEGFSEGSRVTDEAIAKARRRMML